MAGRVGLIGLGEGAGYNPWLPADLKGSLDPSPCAVEAAPLSPRARLILCPQAPHHASHDLPSEPVTLLVIRLWS